jgi:non-ribosomal peptide synthetase component E (peptide arylation enzyme)
MQRWQDVRGLIQKARDQGLSHEELAQAFNRARQMLEQIEAVQAMSRGLGRALTLGQMLDEAAAREPAHEAIVFRDERVSYGQLKARADAFALGLIALGLERGDHVVLWMPNRVEWNVAHLGIAKAGCVTVTCNSRYKALEVEYVLRQSDAKALILADASTRRASTIWSCSGRFVPSSTRRAHGCPPCATSSFWARRCPRAVDPGRRWRRGAGE